MYPGLPVFSCMECVDANIKTLLQHYGGALGLNHFWTVSLLTGVYWYSLQQHHKMFGPSMCKISLSQHEKSRQAKATANYMARNFFSPQN